MNTQTHILLAAALLCRPNAPRANAAVLAGAIVPDAAVTLLFVWGQASGVPPNELWGRIYFGEPMQTVQAAFNSVPLYAALLVVGLAMAERRASTAAYGGLNHAERRTLGAATSMGSRAVGERLATRRARAMPEQRLPTRRPAATPSSAVEPVPAASHGWWDTVGTLSPLALFAIAALVHLAGDLPLHADDAHRHFWPVTDWRFNSPVSYWDPAHHGTLASIAEGVLGVVLCAVLWRRFRARWVRGAVLLATAIYVGVPLYWSTVTG